MHQCFIKTGHNVVSRIVRVALVWFTQHMSNPEQKRNLTIKMNLD